MKVKPEPFDVWVVEVHHHTDTPYVTHYRAIRLSRTGMTVANGGKGHPQIVQAAGGRRFFRDRDQMMAYCRQYMAGRWSYHQRVAQQLDAQLARDDLEMEIRKHGSALR